jgi:hypothetical protein
MTTQISDGFCLDGVGYAVINASDGTLFDPATLGLNPVPATTACWRGYKAVFAIADGQLMLEELHLNLPKCDDKKNVLQKSVLVNEVAPIYEVANRGIIDKLFNHHYEGVILPLTYNGGLLIGTDWIPRRGSAFYPFWQYKKVLELVFEKGVLQAQYDRSQEAVEIREQFDAWRAGEKERPSDKGIREFIAHSFAYTYTKAV